MKSRHFFLVFWTVWMGSLGLRAQQTTLPFYRLINPGMFSPSAAGGHQPHHLWLGIQQFGKGSDDKDSGWNSYSQFLNFNSGDLGLGKRIGWGLRMSHAWQQTLRRVNFAPTFSAQLIETPRLQLGVGILLGFSNWGIDASNTLVADPNDPLVSSPGNHWDLDAGLGFNARYHLPWLRADAAFDCAQLPGNFLSKPLVLHVQVYPFYNAGGGVLFRPAYNIWVGPRVTYHNILPRDTVTALPGGLWIGMQLLFDRQQLWFAGGYDLDAGHLTAGFGLQVLEPDTVAKSGFGIQIQGMGTYPIISPSSEIPHNWGPTIELGVSLIFARKTKEQLARLDSTVKAEDFWRTNAAIARHLARVIGDAGPDGLTAATSVVNRHVATTYSFPDNSFLFIGEGGVIYKDSLISDLGEEWMGVDALLESISNRIVPEAFHPDSTNVRDPENFEPIAKLQNIQLVTHVSFDERAINFVAGETRYDGEIDSRNDVDSILYIRVNYNGSDTTIGVPKGGFVTNLELAALKLHAMRKKLEYELKKNHRKDFLFVWEGQQVTDEEINSGLPIVRLKLPRIIPNNANQQSDYQHDIIVRFERDKKYVQEDNEEEFWDQDEPETKKRKRNAKKAKKAKKPSASQPTRLPDQLPETEQEGTFEAAPEPEEQPEEQPSQDLFDDDGGQ